MLPFAKATILVVRGRPCSCLSKGLKYPYAKLPGRLVVDRMECTLTNAKRAKYTIIRMYTLSSGCLSTFAQNVVQNTDSVNAASKIHDAHIYTLNAHMNRLISQLIYDTNKNNSLIKTNIYIGCSHPEDICNHSCSTFIIFAPLLKGYFFL